MQQKFQFVILTDVTGIAFNQKALGAFKIAHVLRQNGYTCLVVDNIHSFSEKELTTLLDSVVGEETLSLGVSTTFFMESPKKNKEDGVETYRSVNYNTLFPQGKQFENNIISFLHKKNKNIKIIMGGTKSSPAISNKNVDYLFLGFAESSIINFADHLTKNLPLESSYKNLYGITVIDDRTAKNYDFQHSTMKWMDTDVVNAKVLPIEIARGCIFRCKFCSYPLNGKKNLDFIRHADIIYDELNFNYKTYGIKHYYIVDDTFNDNETKLNLLHTAIKRLNFQPNFWAYTRLDLIARHPHTIDLLYDIGVRAFFFGIETLNEKTGRIIGKGYSRSKQIETIKQMSQKFPDISMHGSFIIGLPEDPISSSLSIYEDFISRKMPLSSIQFLPLRLAKINTTAWSSELEINFAKYGYEDTQSNFSNDWISWKNKLCDYETAVRTSTMLNDLVNSSKVNTIDSGSRFALINYGIDLEQSWQRSWHDFNWNEHTEKKKMYLNQYKQKLFDMLGIDYKF